MFNARVSVQVHLTRQSEPKDVAAENNRAAITDYQVRHSNTNVLFFKFNNHAIVRTFDQTKTKRIVARYGLGVVLRSIAHNLDLVGCAP